MGEHSLRNPGPPPGAGPEIPVVETVESVRHALKNARAEGLRIGLVPTMGALHEAHVRLIEACRRNGEFVVVSNFVNPTQFGPGEDFERYPRTLDADRLRCAEGGASLIFAPSVAEMYPGGRPLTFVEVPGLSDVFEGASRPGHFRGVATVVMKLFQIVQPDVACFGEKDYQQLLVIRRMVEDLDVPVVIRSMPTVREPDGLAMSSRNRYLNPDQRRAARVLSTALFRAREAVQEGERDADRIRQNMRETVELEALAKLDYAEVADAATLEPLTAVGDGRNGVALLAVRIGPARLIDNLTLSG
jgi:pantoate--beta-alanine ligase